MLARAITALQNTDMQVLNTIITGIAARIVGKTDVNMPVTTAVTDAIMSENIEAIAGIISDIETVITDVIMTTTVLKGLTTALLGTITVMPDATITADITPRIVAMSGLVSTLEPRVTAVIAGHNRLTVFTVLSTETIPTIETGQLVDGLQLKAGTTATANWSVSKNVPTLGTVHILSKVLNGLSTAVGKPTPLTLIQTEEPALYAGFLRH